MDGGSCLTSGGSTRGTRRARGFRDSGESLGRRTPRGSERDVELALHHRLRRRKRRRENTRRRERERPDHARGRDRRACHGPTALKAVRRHCVVASDTIPWAAPLRPIVCGPVPWIREAEMAIAYTSTPPAKKSIVPRQGGESTACRLAQDAPESRHAGPSPPPSPGTGPCGTTRPAASCLRFVALVSGELAHDRSLGSRAHSRFH